MTSTQSIFVLIFLSGCLVDDTGIPSDENQSGGTDAMPICTSGVPFEAEIISFETRQRPAMAVDVFSVEGALLEEVAPNGRLFLCVNATGPTVIQLVTEGGHKHFHTIAPSTAAANYDSGQTFQIELSQSSTFAARLQDVGINLEPNRSVSKYTLRNYPSGLPVANAAVSSQNINAGTFITQNGSFFPSNTTDQNGDIWIANVESTNNNIILESTSSQCNITVGLYSEPGAVSSTLAGCF